MKKLPLVLLGLLMSLGALHAQQETESNAVAAEVDYWTPVSSKLDLGGVSCFTPIYATILSNWRIF